MKLYSLITTLALANDIALGFLAPQTITSKRIVEPQRHQLNVLPSGLENEIPHLTIAAQVDPKALLESYRGLLIEHPIPTKAATAATLAVAGDAIVQAKEDTYDSNRALAFGLFAAIYTGAYQHFWFTWLDSHVNDFYQQFAQAPEQALPQLYLALSAATKVCTNQVMIGMAYMPFFFAITGALSGLTVDESVKRAKSLYFPILIRNCAFWMPTQFIQFYAIDPEWQITYLCVAGLVWNAILSALAGDTSKDGDSTNIAENGQNEGLEVVMSENSVGAVRSGARNIFSKSNKEIAGGAKKYK